MTSPTPQPYLHELVSCVHAPAVALSGADGQIRPGGVHGVFRNDRRVLAVLTVDVDGHEPTPVGHRLAGPNSCRFVGIIRHVGDPSADPTVWLERERRVHPDGMSERLALVNRARGAVSVTVRVQAAVDLAGVSEVKAGKDTAELPPQSGEASLIWGDDQVRVMLTGTSGPAVAGPTLAWSVTVPARGRWEAELNLAVAEPAPAPEAFLPAPAGLGWSPAAVEVAGPQDLALLVDHGLRDLSALTLADPAAPGDVFAAAGSPWYFTLFGRDALWAARFVLPLGTDLARGTLRALARRQGRRHDPATAEAPGKILHEVRTDAARGWLPPVYFGTVDATSLWVCLLHDAWLWGMAASDVAELLDPLVAALGWVTGAADSDGDGLLEYVDASGRGLTNQGWKDSTDSIQFADGRLATAPVALSEAQAYAHQAALAGARLLTAFGRPGAEELIAWAAGIQTRFRERFWVADARGSFPAIALDAAKRPVDTATSNLGHLLGTGLLDPAEAAAVATRLSRPDLDCGYGLRTMTADAAGFNPLGYHTGSVWPHDTAIAVQGLLAEGHGAQAASLAAGLLRAAPAFAHRLPELYAGTDARAGEPVLAYPPSCRPQAWSAAAPVAMLTALLGLHADVPAGVLRVRPDPAFAGWWPLRVAGLRVAGHPLVVSVEAADAVIVDTTAPLTVEVGG